MYVGYGPWRPKHGKDTGMEWRLIRSGYQSGAMNMALDEALLQSVATGRSLPVLHLYRWQPPTVTLGYAQSVAEDINLDACRSAGLDVVRRVTGGRAVLHDHEVTYGIMAPVQQGLFEGSVLECYKVIAEALQLTLQRLGLNARLVPGRRSPQPAAAERAVCFTAPSQYELVIDGRKVAGSAQKRQGKGFLQHGSLPLEMDLDLLARVLPGNPALSAGQRFSKIGWLNRWADPPLVVDEVEDSLVTAFGERLGIRWRISVPDQFEQGLAEQLYRDKYGIPQWTLQKRRSAD